MDRNDLINDIPIDLARAAHAGTSFDPEMRGDSERAGYANTLARDFEMLSKYADTDDKRATLATEFERYRVGYRTRFVALLAARSRCVSIMITGGSNFPVRRQAKRNATSDRRVADLLDYHKRALAAIVKILRPELRPIMAGDANAVERLETKVDKDEALLARMKATNAAIRKHKKAGADAQVVALIARGFTEAASRGLLVPDDLGRIGFASYQITNLAANIRRVKARTAVVAEAKVTEATETEGAIARLEDAPSDNRVRLFFPGKPDSTTRARLKSAGFRWTPSLGCWQAYRNHNTLTTAKREAGVTAKENAS